MKKTMPYVDIKVYQDKDGYIFTDGDKVVLPVAGPRQGSSPEQVALFLVNMQQMMPYFRQMCTWLSYLKR